jgi:hypothetical protein
MKILDRHIRLLSGILLVLVAVSSSGFMTLIYTCAMPGQCCVMMEDSCQQDIPAGATLSSPFRCITTSIAGSPSTLQGFLQTISSPIALDFQFVLPAGVQIDAGLTPATVAHFFDTSPPPRVERYLLTQSFLI